MPLFFYFALPTMHIVFHWLGSFRAGIRGIHARNSENDKYDFVFAIFFASFLKLKFHIFLLFSRCSSISIWFATFYGQHWRGKSAALEEMLPECRYMFLFVFVHVWNAYICWALKKITEKGKSRSRNRKFLSTSNVANVKWNLFSAICCYFRLLGQHKNWNVWIANMNNFNCNFNYTDSFTAKFE